MDQVKISIPTLETPRLKLRGFSNSDFEPLCEFYKNEETARFVGGIETPQQVWRRMASYIGHWALRGYGIWALESKETGAFVGYVGNWFPEGWPEPEIAYGLIRAGQGQGLATEAATAALRHAYIKLGWSTAISAIDAANAASAAVVKRMGAEFEAHKRVAFFSADIYRHVSPNKILDI